MAKSSTNNNEDLACIALAYLSKNSNATYDNFHDWLTDTLKDWSSIIEDCELNLTNGGRFKTIYADDSKGNHNPWIKTSYMTAKTLKQKLNLNLSQYVFCAIGEKTIGKNRWNSKGKTGYIIKSTSVSAIKNLYKFYTNKNTGVLANLMSDKYIISDIFLCKKQNPYLIQLIRLINKANSIETKKQSILNRFSDISNKEKILKYKKFYVGSSDLNIELYTSIINKMWDDKELIGVSLKGLGSNPPDDVSSVPFSILNYTQKPNIDFEEDEIVKFLDMLFLLAKQKNLSDFVREIEKVVSIDSNIVFSQNDRLDVDFTLNFNDKSKEYTLWTNFGDKSNSVYISPKNSNSASGGGGVTLSYFYSLIKEYPNFKNFLKKLASTREKYFFESLKKYNSTYQNINHFYSSHNIENDLKLNYFANQGTLYSSAKWDKFISKSLKTESSMILLESKTKDKTKRYISSVAKGKDQNKKAIYAKTKTSIEVSLLESIKDFYASYTSFLSNSSGSMGQFFAYKNTTISEMKQHINQGNYEKFYSSTQKSFALLTNAEFGFTFSTHNKWLKEFVKKQLLLSLYSASSGRGYIIFSGKRFRSGEIYVDKVKSPVYVKVGK
jgi:hypothetical protein